MAYVVPESARLLCALGAGSIFDVALVEYGGRRCVCKRLKLRMLEEPVAESAIAREASLLERARHPALPELIARGDDGHGPFVIESVAPGASLSAVVARAATTGDEISAARVAGWATAAFAALAELHALVLDGEPLGFVHGDLAPDHVWVEGHSVSFIDLGQARWRGMGAAGDGDKGTLPYVAPEVLRGESPPSQAGDVYALAASIAFVALGREPCNSEGPARLVEVAEHGLDLEALAASPRLEPPLLMALSRALAFQKQTRAMSATEILALLSG